MTGRTLGHYEIHEKLGEGGMGVVFKARDTNLQRFAAVKVLPAGRLGDAEARARLIQEARSASALNHPNIVTVYEVNTDGDDLYIAMELVDGKPLSHLIPAGGMRTKDATELAIQIASALAAAQDAKLVHRDLKPGNIMLTTDGKAKLLDFGLAKFMAAVKPEEATLTIAQGTYEDSIVGTVPYMSPEQAEGKPVDARSDIFSFGAVLYEMLSGERAFQGNSVPSTLAAILDRDPPALSNGVPQTLRSIVSRCLRKDPLQRYQHAGDLRILLEDAVAGQGHDETAGKEAGISGVRFGWRYLVVTAAILISSGLVWDLRPQPAPQINLQLKRLTGDDGLTVGATISPDGRLIAYASDRAGNGDLDIWVQHRAGGDPIRITHTNSNEFDPAFSTDGSQLVYAGSDGVYLVPALGGEPRHLTQAGVRPRLSPDGKRVIYQNNSTVRFFTQIFLFDIESGQQQRLAKDLSLARYPVWSPDGKSLLIETVDFTNKSQGEADWRILSLGTQKSVNIGTSPGVPLQWLPGDRILFKTVGMNRQTLDESNLNFLGIVGISAARGRFAKDPQRLSDGTGVIESGSVAMDGTLIVALDSYRANLWDLPFDSNTGKAIGSVEALTKDVGLTAYPSISSDGRRLAFTSNLDGSTKIWLMDLASGKRRKLTPLGEEEFYPALSPDGTKVAYILKSRTGLSAIMTADVTLLDQPGVPRNACPRGCMVPWAWWPDNRGILVSNLDGKVIGDVKPEGGVREFAKANSPLFQSHPSPDGQWMLILRGGLWLARLYEGSMPDQSQWKQLQGPGKSDLPRWSADGNTVYFVSGRDSFHCIYGQHLDALSKEPVGDVFPVYHSHRARVSIGGLPDSGAVGLAVAGNRIIFAQAERSGNVWIGKLESK